MMVGMRILVIGSGGREHALVKGLSADPKSTEIHAAPGSAAMSALATVHPDYSQVDDADRMVELAQSIAADLVVIGPEVPLVAGVADALRAAGIAVFGPSKDAAQIEGSKAFAKDVMESAGVKTARAEQLRPGAGEDDIEAALDRFGIDDEPEDERSQSIAPHSQCQVSPHPAPQCTPLPRRAGGPISLSRREYFASKRQGFR